MRNSSPGSSGEAESGVRSLRRESASYRLSPAWVELLLPVGYVGLVVLFSPFLRSFENDTDEGFNVIKASALRSGARLYGEIWSDQPPYFTDALGMLWSVTGESVMAARLLVLASSALLLWAAMRIARRSWGVTEAVVTFVLLLFLPAFQRLSVSVMIGLPALALAMAALALAIEWHSTPRWLLAVASGALFGLATFTKFFVALLCPVLLIAIAIGAPRRMRFLGCLAWGAGFGVAAFPALLQIIGAGGVDQLFRPHLLAAQVPAYQAVGGVGSLFGSGRMAILAGVAVAGAVVSRRAGLPIVRLAAIWSVLALIAFARHRPLWYHQTLLLALPLSLLAVPAIVAAWRWSLGQLPYGWGRSRNLRLGLAIPGLSALVGVAAVDGGWRFVDSHDEARRLLRVEGHPVLERLESMAEPTDLILTDRPMFAFRAGLRVPPEAAVVSDKRLRAGLLGEVDLLNVLHARKPELVLLERFSFPDLRSELRRTYRLAYSRRQFQLFVARAPDSQMASGWPDCGELPDAWYRGPEAARVKRNILDSQREDGGWAGGEDRTVPFFPAPENEDCDGQRYEGCSTLFDGATTAELRFLGRMIHATADRGLVPAFERGLDYVLRSQDTSGGWPRVAMSRPGSLPARLVVKNRSSASGVGLLQAIAEEPTYSFVDGDRRGRAAAAVREAIEFFLRTQVSIGGAKTIWSSYYDPGTLRPAGGRRREPPMLVVEDSVEVLRVLLRVQPPTHDVEAAIRAGLDWLDEVRAAPSGEARWFRFYDLESGRPILEDHEGDPWRKLEAQAREGRIGGRHFTTEPAALLTRDARSSLFEAGGWK